MKTEKKLTLRQIAQLARTSKSTVSRVLTNHPSVSPATRARIEAAIRKHGYAPNFFARGLAGGRTGLIATLATEINSGFFAEVLKGVNQVVLQNGGHVMSSFARDADDYIHLWKNLSEQGRADGLILIAPPVEVLAEAFAADEQPPTVLCACRPVRNTFGWDNVSSVTVGNRQGMTEILQHLAERGCRHVAYLAGPTNVYDAQERVIGVKAFSSLRPGFGIDIVQAGQNREEGYQAALDYMSKRSEPPDAFVAFNDSTAYGVLQAMKEIGVAVPGQTRVAGCDDEDAAAAVGLTTLHMNMVDLGQEAARLLFRHLNARDTTPDAEHIVIDMQVRARSTS
ncbi:MAG TPA: LacI family DNA-binding transcriptional regulator [Kiritimatiellia bacterium]|jgi:LacI family transcriptional regulator